MKTLFAIFLSVLSAVFVISCGGGDTFTVIAKVENLGTQNVRAIYRSDDKVNVITSMALDGAFQFTAVAKEPVLIDLYTGSRALIGRVVACNGETVEVSYRLNEPGFMTAKGDRISESLARFITDNSKIIDSGDGRAVNEAVARYCESHRDDRAVPYIFLSLYRGEIDRSVAAGLVESISGDSRSVREMLSSYGELLAPVPDSLPVFEPVNLYSVGDSMTTVRPCGSKGVFLAILPVDDQETTVDRVERLNALNDSLKGRARVVELSLEADTAAWREAVKDLKPRYGRCWSPGMYATPGLGRYNITGFPWYIAADSTGTVLYSGPEYETAFRSL